ncbi:hypothetical protein ACBJ59_43725 [Nonomuraea sp. MTCD27]|uniref:hypothetical protein n=1 Tax=Nonomuraea sp. MTCD27 TaxID=1676747 RepID=UPI0035BFC463
MDQDAPPPRPEGQPTPSGQPPYGGYYDAWWSGPSRRTRSAAASWLFRIALWLTPIVVTGLLALITTRSQPGERPEIHLGVTYSSHLSCHDACTVWAGTETITLELPAQVPELSGVTGTLSGKGWASAPTPARFGKTRAQAFTRTVHLPQPATPTGFPVTITHRIPIPAVVEGRESMGVVRGTSENVMMVNAAGLRRTRELIGRPLPVFLIPGEGSKVVLRHPRLSVEATTPTSEPVAMSGGREERTIDVSEPDAYDDHAVTVDVRATALRESTIATVLEVRHSVWAWLVVLALLGLVAAAVRRRIDLRLDRVRLPAPASAAPAPPAAASAAQAPPEAVPFTRPPPRGKRKRRKKR